MKPNRQLLQLTGNLRAYLLATSGLGVMGGVVAVGQALCVSQAVDGVFLGGAGLAQVGVWLWLLLGVMVVRAGLLVGGEVAANRAAGQAKLRLRGPFFSKLLALGPAYTRGERSGELVSVASDGVEALDAYFSQYLPQLFNTILVPLVVALAVFGADLLSGAVLLLTMPVLPIFMILVGKMADAQARKQWRTLSLLSAHCLDVLSGLTTLKLFGRSIIQKEKIAHITEQHRNATMSVLRVAFLSTLVLEMAATISTAVIAVEIGLRLLYGGIPFAQAFFVLLLAPEFYMPFRALGARFHAAMSGGQAADRMLQIMSNTEFGVRNAECTVVPDLAHETIRFENVFYSYDAREEHTPDELSGASVQPPKDLGIPHSAFRIPHSALRAVSFSIEPGSRVAFVGPTGGGKSTIASLLLRFIEPSAGAIYVGDTALGDFGAEEWRKLVAWVPQHPYLFHTSVAENIRIGKPGATMPEIESASRVAQAHDFIMALPHGYETIIGERGARLSGGQAQRIGMARAFLKDAPLLILDEATSNLDPEHEHLIMEAVESLMKGRTTIIIAHRLATVTGASKVIVLDGGHLVESGDHKSLVERDGIYRRLVDANVGVAS